MRRLGSEAQRRLMRREAHGMQQLLQLEQLRRAPTSQLERFVLWLGLMLPTKFAAATDSKYRMALIYTIMREEKRLAKCRRSERWERTNCVA